MGHFYYSENLNWAAQNPRLGRMRPGCRGLDIAAIDHDILDTFHGIRGLPLKLLVSYLQGHQQYIVVGGCRSSMLEIT